MADGLEAKPDVKVCRMFWHVCNWEQRAVAGAGHVTSFRRGERDFETTSSLARMNKFLPLVWIFTISTRVL